MRRTLLFAEGLGTGAGLLLMITAALLFSRSRAVSATMHRRSELRRLGRSPWTGEPRADYLEQYRAAGL